jgi:hypothetical protein
MKIELREKIEKRDIVVIGVSALGGFLLVFIIGVLKGKDPATALLVGLLLGAPSGAFGGVSACLLPRKLFSDLFLGNSIREYTNAELRTFLIAGTIFWVAAVLGTFGGTQSGWLLWPVRLLSVYALAGVWYKVMREFRRRRRGEAP